MTKLIDYFDSLNKILDDKERKLILREYNNWVVEQPSIIDGDEKVSKPHHVRTATNSGTGIKPNDLYQVPVTYAQHTAFHKHGTYRQEFLDKLPGLHDQFLDEHFWIKNLI